MLRTKSVWAIFKKELHIEQKNPHVLGGLVLYAISTLFVCWLAIGKIQNIALWNALFWVITLFGIFNSSHRIFAQEQGLQKFYLPLFAHPLEVLLGKALFSTSVNIVLYLFTFLLFSIFFGFPAPNFQAFASLFGTASLGIIGLSVMLTLISGIAHEAGNNPSLIAILGLPIVLPLLLLCIRLTKLILDGLDVGVWGDYAWSLFGLTAAIIALACLLFPYLWRE